MDPGELPGKELGFYSTPKAPGCGRRQRSPGASLSTGAKLSQAWQRAAAGPVFFDQGAGMR